MNERSEKILNRALYDLNSVCANLKDSLNDENKTLVCMHQNMQEFQKDGAYVQETIDVLNLAIAGVEDSLVCIKILKNREERKHEKQ